MKPLMTENEFQLLFQYAKNQKSYFEWGCGGTSFQAAMNDIHVTCIDTDANWIQDVQTNVKASPFFTGIHVNLGPVGPYGTPLQRVSGRPYFQQVPSSSKLVFIDGRFRVACALQVLLVCDPTVTVLIHDFEREYYHTLLDFYTVEQQVERMAVLKPKSSIRIADVKHSLAEYEFDSR